MATSCNSYLMIYSTTSSNSIKKMNHHGQVTATTQQWMSEQQIFDSVNHRTLIHIPSAPIKANQKKQQKKRKPTSQDNNNSLNLQTKIPLNIGSLDNILFVSTLHVVEEGCWSTRTTIKRPMTTTTTEMKRQSSLSQHQQQPIYYPKRYSQPETIQQQRYNPIIIQQQQPYDYNSSSCSSSNSSITSIAERRMSIQSDAALSTELIRRFSSGSTTSTVATSISASSSLLVDTATTTKSDDIIIHSDDAQTHYHQSNAILLNEPTPPDDDDSVVLTKSNNNNIPTNEQKQQLGHDPGHARDTMHSPYTLQQQQHNKLNQQQQQTAAPVWADPIKVKENPTRYEYLVNYLKENQISFSSSLPLQKSCLFYFSDNNNNKEESYMSAVKSVFQCDTVWQFSSRWRTYKEAFCKKPSQLLPNQNLFCFIKEVEPMWEDEVNQKGGRLTITIQNNTKLLDDVFEWILCSFIGAGLFDHGVVGIILSRRNRGDRIELWLDQSNSTATSISLFKEKLCGLLPATCHNEINASRYKKHF